MVSTGVANIYIYNQLKSSFTVLWVWEHQAKPHTGIDPRSTQNSLYKKKSLGLRMETCYRTEDSLNIEYVLNCMNCFRLKTALKVHIRHK